ncbi:MAG TPA: ATP-binding protein, partial [Anaerolineaceae bacterium]|nr:ATP-binding protein [Anaerolineaceae bacterium]
LLLRAIDRIAYQQGKKRELVRDQLGQSIGRNGSTIDYWIYRKHMPAHIEDLENLARQIALLNGWQDVQDCLEFLLNGSHPSPNALIQTIYPQATLHAPNQTEETLPLPKSLSPFVVGVPIQYPLQFFGRDRELRRIFSAIQGHLLQNVAITGAQRSGKTSLLHYLRKITRANFSYLRPNQFTGWLSRPSTYRWVFVDFQDARTHTQEGLFRFILNRLALPVPSHCTLSNFIDTLGDNTYDPTVILMDEIQVALEINEFDQQFWWGLRSLATNITEGKLCFIIASQKEPFELFYQSERPSPFFNIFGHTVTLGPITEGDARALIGNSPTPFDPGAVDWILQASHIWPALIQILCQEHLLTLEENAADKEAWKTEGLKKIAPFRHLLEIA